jgi:glycogen operon protein
MATADLLGYRVLLLEREGVAFRPPDAYPAGAVACVTTHDLPTFAGWWSNTDIDERDRLGLIAPGGVTAAFDRRDQEKTALVSALSQAGIEGSIDEAADPSIATLAGVYRYIGRSPAVLALVQADDLAGERVSVNLPGTNWERPNWRRRLAPGVETLLETGDAAAILAGLRDGRI